MGLSPT